MSYNLIIAEKPSAAKKIADALSNGGAQTTRVGQVSYHTLKRNGKNVVVACAVGHLYGVTAISKAWTYPIFDIEWLATHKIDKHADYTKKYLDVIKKLAKGADSFVIATDLDIEGETIAYNILKYACKQNDAKRMKFSTLTKKELENSYDNALPHILFGLAEAGSTRHVLDFYFGINVSRALTLAVRHAGKYKLLTAGRVQGPALNFLAKREKEISIFKPVPYFELESHTKYFIAQYKKGAFSKKEDAQLIFDKCKDKNGVILKTERKKYNNKPPTPFNLTDLQVEAHKLFGIKPSETQKISQKLYEQAAMSYPRTSSQKLPVALDFKTILTKLKSNITYDALATKVLAGSLIPNEGKKTDDAHPAIHPTGERPKDLTDRERKIYDLIVKRFFAVFGTPAVRESMAITLSIVDEEFIAKGSRTVEKNWFELYEPYVRLDEVSLPDLTEGDSIDIKKLAFLSKETKPPNRYNQASIIRELEKRGLGTKATRAEIVGNLYKRGYLKEDRIEVTPLGLKVVETLEKYCPEIISEELTRKFEGEMEQIEKSKLKGKIVLDDAEKELTTILEKFKKNEGDIGQSLLDSAFKAQEEENILGKCPKCEKGNLRMMKSRTGSRFVGCTSYPDCKNIYPLPRMGSIQKTGNVCEKCNTPFVKVINKGRKPWLLCIDPKCPTKANWGKKPAATKTVAKTTKKVTKKTTKTVKKTKATATKTKKAAVKK
ncbi:DNA topoisomerase I [archaeon]|nr:DNA topoisomerase I [archaeon]